MPLTTITVGEVVQARPTMIAADRSVREALDALLDSPHECLVVVDSSQHPVGIVTEGDIVRRVLAEEVPGGSYLRAILVSADSALDHLRRHDVSIDFHGRRRAGAQVAVEFRDPDNHVLEIYWCIDQVGSDGRSRPPEDWREALTIEDAIDDPPPGQDTTLHDPSLVK